ncbi:MAG: cytochrome C oxidase subunit IV family protein [Fimbriimonas ginsengisoli]|uniref:Cytochrome C oxidase subunit IV family protein n=1 Tax=Fimbriimonas ginsengisoli TaxID=1005039 RepID=A0A931PTV7_FIMGI|nr:cytochrome C oxidase subunit IV family protein [Fimbriimonas ginsengisoli]MBI3720962.1 cytochrome C oxidase subunit IV family protein [Fimbriimonas ginsengisoli]
MTSHDTPSNGAHILPISVYAKTLLVLLVLMAITVWAGQQTLPGGTVVNNIVAMSIAVIKASLVVMFFMHVKFSSKLTQFWAVVGFLWLTLLFMILVDYYSRAWEPVDSWNQADPGSSTPRGRMEPGGAHPDPNGFNVRPR